jgi:hypothetical protein
MIAEFMRCSSQLHLIEHPITGEYIDPVDFKYHQSWDWLMPVIEKISKIYYEDGYSSYPRTFGMINEETGNFIFRFNRYPAYEHHLLITAAYFAVLNYIEHYNTLNQ